MAPSAGVEKIGEVVHVDTNAPDFGDPTVRYVEIAGDSALEVEGDDGLTLIVNDLIGDIHGEEWSRWVAAQGHGIRRRRTACAGAGEDAAGQAQERSRATVQALGGRDDLRRIIVSHGDTIESDPRGALRKLAASID